MTHPITEKTAPRAPDRRDRPCEDCGKVFTPTRGRQVFCAVACKNAAKDRAAVRGKTIMPLALAWRAGKSGKGGLTSKQAFRELCSTLDRFNAEDKAAGRATAIDVMARQYRHGVRKE